MTAKGLTVRYLAAAFMIASIVINGARAHGDDTEYRDPGYGMGYDMESGMMEEYCPGCGMTGGYGMGPGMMGGYGMHPRMTGAGPVSGVELSADQRRRMFRIQSELRKQNWALQGKIIDAREQLLELYLDDTPDAKKVGSVYAKIFDLRRQMIEAAIDARNRKRAVLTQEHRERLRKGAHGRSGGEMGPESGQMAPRHRQNMMGE